VQLRPGHSVQHLLLQQVNVSWMLNKTGRSDWSTACHPHYGRVPTISVLVHVTVTFDTMLDILLVRKHRQWNGPSVTKPNQEKCKNCSSKCAYHCTTSVHNTAKNSSDNLHLLPPKPGTSAACAEQITVNSTLETTEHCD